MGRLTFHVQLGGRKRKKKGEAATANKSFFPLGGLSWETASRGLRFSGGGGCGDDGF